MSSKRKVKQRPRLWWFIAIVAAWLVGHFALQDFDSSLYKLLGRYTLQWGGDEYAQFLHKGDIPEQEEVHTKQAYITCPSIGTVELNESTAQDCFAALPLGPQDLGALLRFIHGAGVQTAGVSSPLTWEDEVGDMACNMVGTMLGKFKASVIGMRGRTAAQADFTPSAMREFAIPPENLLGDSKGIPNANRPIPNGLTEANADVRIPWAPDWLEDEPQTQEAPSLETISYPLIVRWNNAIIPTLPLCLAMKSKGIEPADVFIEFGKEIRIKDRTLPLDQHGRTRLNPGVHRIVPLPLKEVVGGKGDTLRALGEEKGSCVLLAEPMGDKPETERLQAMAHTLAELMGEQRYRDIVSHRPLGGHVLQEAPIQRSWWTLVWLLPVLALCLLVLPAVPTLLRRIITFGALAYMVYYVRENLVAGYWLSFTALLSAWFVTVLAIHCLKKGKKDPHSRCRHV